MREIDTIVIHCSATPPNMDVDADTIRDWHVNERGWSDIGYHFVITRDGTCEGGRPLETPGAHAKGFNQSSIGICLVGGVDKNNKSQANFTFKQYKSMENLVSILAAQHGITKIIGHNQVSDKDCPCFDVEAFFDANS